MTDTRNGIHRTERVENCLICMGRAFRRLPLLSLAVLCTAHLCGCATSKRPALSSEHIVAEDRLLIVFTSQPYSVGFRRVVDAKGEIDLPHGVKLNVAGMGLRQTEQAISYRYSNCFNPSRQILVSKWEF